MDTDDGVQSDGMNGQGIRRKKNRDRNGRGGSLAMEIE